MGWYAIKKTKTQPYNYVQVVHIRLEYLINRITDVK